MPWWRYAASTIATVGFSAAGVANEPVRRLKKLSSSVTEAPAEHARRAPAPPRGGAGRRRAPRRGGGAPGGLELDVSDVKTRRTTLPVVAHRGRSLGPAVEVHLGLVSLLVHDVGDPLDHSARHGGGSL